MGKTYIKLTSKAKDTFDPTAFEHHPLAAPIHDALIFTEGLSHIGKNFCEEFLSLAQEGLTQEDVPVQTESLALAKKIAATTDDEDIRARSHHLIDTHLNKSDPTIGNNAQERYAALSIKS